MYRILSVDDELTNQKLIQRTLEKEFHVTLANNSAEALRIVESEAPDLILLDVNMPGQDGLNTCQRIREIAGMEELPVIFVSALSTLDDKLKGYEAGGNDYIGKPIELPELTSKINVLLEQKNKYADIYSSLSDARNAMFSAMNYASELGSVINFFERGFGSNTLEDLAKAVFFACSKLGLTASMQIRGAGEVSNFSSRNVVAPLEAELLTQAKYGERIITYGDKSIYNADSITILVKNMPIDNGDLCGRIRDHLAIVLRACEAQIELIQCRNNTRVMHNQNIDKILENLDQDFDTLNEMLVNYQNKVESSLEEFQLDFTETAILCDIRNEQLKTLMESFGRLFQTHKSAEHQTRAIENIIISIAEKIASMKQA